jgi:hypothetical protein
MFSAVEGMMKILLYVLFSTALVVLLMVTAALVWGGPGTRAPITSINDPFESVQLLPGVQHIPLTLDPTALKAIAEQVQKLHAN